MQNQETPALPLSGVAIIALVIGWVVVHESAFHGSRPTNPHARAEESQQLEDVRARLWEDPFDAVLRYSTVSGAAHEAQPSSAQTVRISARETGSASTAGTAAREAAAGTTEEWSLEVQTGESREDQHHSLLALCRAIHDRIPEGSTNRVTVLGVMVFGSPYAEDREGRLRTRYAVLSALGMLRYSPEDAEHIGYVRLSPSLSPNPDAAESVSRVVPYEWLRRAKGRDSVLVLWLNDEMFQEKPFRTLGTLIQEIRDDSAPDAEDCLRFKLLAPAGSGNLVAMARELVGEDEAEHWERLHGVEIFSPTATAVMAPVLSATGGAATSADNTSSFEDWYERRVGSGRFLRTINTDRRLADTLLEELGRRGVYPADPDNGNRCILTRWAIRQWERLTCRGSDSSGPYGGHRHHAVLISEWDTFYGRALPQAFVDAVQPQCPSGEDCTPWIHRFSYLRGLDGRIPGDKTDDGENNADSRGDAQENLKVRLSEIEPAVGDSQFDYLRRLAHRVERLDRRLRRSHQGSVKAIGVLGSDIYDKLLVLQALRERFPNTIFFTTDLDARYLHPAEYQWTRNLIVVSGFGLELVPGFQGAVPPFRDSYQTSRYFTTLLAMDDAAPSYKQAQLYDLLSPRVFEIGRNHAFDLSVDSAPGPAEDTAPSPDTASLPWGDTIYPARARAFPEPHTIVWLAIAALLAGYPLYFLNSVRAAGMTLCNLLRLRMAQVYFAAIGLSVAVALFYSGHTPWEAGEPFRLLGDGVSIWPAEIVRGIAGLLGALFMAKGWHDIKENDERLEKDGLAPSVDPDAPKERPDLSITSWRNYELHGHGATYRDASQLWVDYCRHRCFTHRWKRVLPPTAAFYVLGCVVIYGLDELHVPFRGEASYWVDKIVLLFFAVPMFLVLLFGVVDETRLCVSWIRWLSRTNLEWPGETYKKYRDVLNLPRQCLRVWLHVRVIAERTKAVGPLVYWPFLVYFVMLLSQSPYFDNWDMPVGLITIIVASGLYAMACAVILRRAAEEARSTAIDRLATLCIAEPQADKRKRIQLLIDDLKAMREGAFQSWSRQPVIKALLWFASGGGLLGLQYLALGS